jgi:hypothetical protein
VESAGVVLIVMISLIGIGIHVAGNSKARDVVDMWADENHLQVVDKRYLQFGGKFFFSRSKAQRVYRVTVIDASGRQRVADVKCGGFMVGMLNESVNIRWHDE